MAGGLVFVSILAVDKVFYVHRHPSEVQTMIPSIGRHLPFSTLCFARASTMIAFCFLSIPYRRYAGYQLVGFGTDEQKKRASTGKRKNIPSTISYRQQSYTYGMSLRYVANLSRQDQESVGCSTNSRETRMEMCTNSLAAHPLLVLHRRTETGT